MTLNARLVCFLILSATLVACRGESVSVEPTRPAANGGALSSGATPVSRTTGAVLPDPAVAAAERVNVSLSRSSQTYQVSGSTPDELLSYIENYGPVDDKGQRASGVTHYTSRLDWRSNGDQPACAIASMTIYVDLQVVLPALDSTANPSLGVRASWTQFANGVAAHEQRHVDIYTAGADGMKERMLAIQPTGGCSALESQVNNIWTGQQQAIDAEQELFHQDERRRVDAARAPLKVRIDANRAQLDSYNAQIDGLDASLNTLTGQLAPLKSLLDSLSAQLEAIEDRYQGQALPADVFPHYELLRNQYNNLIPGYNALIDQYNTLSQRRSALVSQAQALEDQTSVLVDQYNWTR